MPVPADRRAPQVGDVRDRWSWAAPSVWTRRMLTALEQGVKGGKWFRLFDKVFAERNLRASFARVKSNAGSAGVDHVTVDRFEARLDGNLDRLHRSLHERTYRPSAVRRVWIPKEGRKEKRPLGIPTVRDRVVQTALRHVLEPIFERNFAPHSYGFRPGRGCHDALRRVDGLLNAGHVWVVDADIRSYFDAIPRDRLMVRLREKVADGPTLALVEAFLDQDVLDGAALWTPGRGTPQGAVISPLLANIYLDPLDHRMADAGFEMVRYADDFVILCRSEADARRAHDLVGEWIAQAGLELHPDKTRIVNATTQGGFDFLGYHFERGYRWPSRKSARKLKHAIRAKTRRTNGHSLGAIISDVNRTLRGWFEYFQYGQGNLFNRLDEWTRMRLRSILRRRSGRRGRGRGADHQRWTKVFFAERGLVSLATARLQAGRPSWR